MISERNFYNPSIERLPSPDREGKIWVDGRNDAGVVGSCEHRFMRSFVADVKIP